MSWRNEVNSGDRIGRYELLEELGRGAMGRVFLAKDHELREHLCVKVLHQAMNRFPAVVERFSREIVLARRARRCVPGARAS